MHTLKNFAFIVNKNKPNSLKLAQHLQSILKKNSIQCDITTEFPLPKNFIKDKDICLVFGGDGTILSIVNEVIEHNVPVLGINHGKLGFLSTFSNKEAELNLPDIINGRFHIENRAILECKTANNQKAFALNDVVIKQTDISRLAQLEVFSNNQRITEYYCDGLIFSTPTGSTAYNLSAFGPIVYPDAKITIMTPICPHSLTNRSVIFDSATMLETRSSADPDLNIAIDGNILFKTPSAFPISIHYSKKTFPLIKMTHQTHSDILRQKLKWG